MKKPLARHRNALLGRFLALQWRQWSALGVAGHAAANERHFVDPEALLAFTCVFGRYDPRLFDEAMDWLAVYERFINTQRLQTLFKRKLFSGTAVVGAIAHFLAKRTGKKRWKNLADVVQPPTEPIPLFLHEDGRPLPVPGERDADFLASGFVRSPIRLRGHSTFRTDDNAAVLLRLRALMGVSARCEILLFLMTNPVGYPRAIAFETHYAQKTVHDALDDMILSKHVFSIKEGRERLCRIEPDALPGALLKGCPAPQWIDWPVVFGALEKVWLTLDRLAPMGLDPLLEASEARKAAKSFVDTLHRRKSIAALAAPNADDLDACMRPIREMVKLLEQ